MSKLSCQEVFGKIFEVFYIWKEKSVGSMVTTRWMVVQHFVSCRYSDDSFWSGIWTKSTFNYLIFSRCLKGTGSWPNAYSSIGYYSYPQREFGHGPESHEETRKSRSLWTSICIRGLGVSSNATLQEKFPQGWPLSEIDAQILWSL